MPAGRCSNAVTQDWTQRHIARPFADGAEQIDFHGPRARAAERRHAGFLASPGIWN